MPTITSKDGTRIAYQREGSGPALIHVAGAIQHRAIDPTLAQLSALLADSFTVILYDRRGRGESADAPQYAVERELEDIAALIDVVSGRAALLGYSSGAVLAAEAALAGLPVESLMLYEPPFALPPARQSMPADYLPKLDGYIARGDRDGAARHFFIAGAGVPPDMVEGMAASPFWSVVTAIAPTLAYDTRILERAYADGALAQRWAGITTPTLVLDGEATPAELPYIRHAVETVAAAIPNARRRTLPGQGHGPAAEAIAPALREFLGA
ncbi:hypothetical protein XM25_18280 [Devosia sp. H5989]|nr:hypothetical protein XM25_18280 [Devosia sp. H5989]